MPRKLTLNKFKLCIFTCCFILVFANTFASGSSEKNKTKPVKVQPVPYQDASKKARDIENIKKQMAAKPVVSLWLAYLLNGTWPEDAEVTAVYRDAQNTALKAFSKAVEDKDWVSAMRLYNSLTACSIEKAKELPWSVQKIEDELIAATALDEKKTHTVTKLSQFIRGTVTVWVDSSGRCTRRAIFTRGKSPSTGAPRTRRPWPRRRSNTPRTPAVPSS